MEPKFLINIARDFSKVPIGRYPTDSDSNGEVFREKFLAPALRSNKYIEVNLDGTEGYGSSFLEEAFGGLIRHHKFTAPELIDRISFISEEDPSLVQEILDYISTSKSQQG